MSMTVTESWPVLCSDVESEPCSDSLRRCQPRSILILVFIIYVFYRKIPWKFTCIVGGLRFDVSMQLNVHLRGFPRLVCLLWRGSHTGHYWWQVTDDRYYGDRWQMTVIFQTEQFLGKPNIGLYSVTEWTLYNQVFSQFLYYSIITAKGEGSKVAIVTQLSNSRCKFPSCLFQSSPSASSYYSRSTRTLPPSLSSSPLERH